MVNGLRQLLWSCYPQSNELAGDTIHPRLLELREFAPTPAKARRSRLLTLKKPLKRHRVRRIDA